MGVLRAIFGPSKDEIWSQISKDIGGEFIDAGFWGTDVLKYRHGEWEILLDTYTVGHGNGSTTYTRMRTPFVNSDGLRFKIYREGFFSSIGKFFKMQDIEIGDASFDDQFIIKGNNEAKIKLLLNDATLKQLIQKQPRILFEIRDDKTEGVDMLYFQCRGVIKETLQLKALFGLFAATLMRLVQIDSAYENDPNVALQ